MNRWSGRVALVTGASAGTGASICRKLVKNGMIVVGCARSDERIRKIAEEKEVKEAPGKLIAIKCDLSKECDILALFKNIRTSLGRLDVCINNAGLSHQSPLLTGETSDWKNMLEVNVLGLSICTREAVKFMQDKNIKEGQIIHISSMCGHRLPTIPGLEGVHFYSGTKFMVRALTEGLRNELKAIKSPIRISSISPGVVETEFFENFLKKDPSKTAKDLFGTLKALKGENVADTVEYILSTPPHVEVHDILVRSIEQFQ